MIYNICNSYIYLERLTCRVLSVCKIDSLFYFRYRERTPSTKRRFERNMSKLCHASPNHVNHVWHHICSINCPKTAWIRLCHLCWYTRGSNIHEHNWQLTHSYTKYVILVLWGRGCVHVLFGYASLFLFLFAIQCLGKLIRLF